MEILSLVFELDCWSWGLIARYLQKGLQQDFIVKTESFYEWCKKPILEGDLILSQNVTQVPHISKLNKTVCRLGGNRSFADGKARVFLDKIAKCAAVIATNEYLSTLAGSVNANTQLIPNGLDLDIWKPKKGRKWLIKRPRVGFIGNIISYEKREYKGYDYVKEACDSLGLELHEALFRDKQIPHDQMKEKFWDLIDVFVLPTQGEGCSNSIMEATACGMPIITTKTAGFHGELMQHKENVLFCERSTESIKKQLKALIGNKELFKKLHLGSRAFAEQHHDINVIADKYRKLFKSLYYSREHEVK